MTLEDFVRDSLSQIAKGVAAADAAVRDHSASVNPKPHSSVPKDAGAYFTEESIAAYPVEFDVAVTATAEAGSQIKVGVVAGVLGFGGSGKESEQSSNVSRIKFRVYMTLPVGKPIGTQPRASSSSRF